MGGTDILRQVDFGQTSKDRRRCDYDTGLPISQ
jgi:hypothetical protein